MIKIRRPIHQLSTKLPLSDVGRHARCHPKSGVPEFGNYHMLALAAGVAATAAGVMLLIGT